MEVAHSVFVCVTRSLSVGIEAQAIGRVLRCGQTKPCYVHRMYALDPLEMFVQQFAEKRALLPEQDLSDWALQQIDSAPIPGVTQEPVAVAMSPALMAQDSQTESRSQAMVQHDDDTMATADVAHTILSAVLWSDQARQPDRQASASAAGEPST